MDMFIVCNNNMHVFTLVCSAIDRLSWGRRCGVVSVPQGGLEHQEEGDRRPGAQGSLAGSQGKATDALQIPQLRQGEREREKR
jgi:hypothetical protein